MCFCVFCFSVLWLLLAAAALQGFCFASCAFVRGGENVGNHSGSINMQFCQHFQKLLVPSPAFYFATCTEKLNNFGSY
jgi:hypothetical protein